MELQTIEIIEKFKEELDVNGTGGQVFHTTQILDKGKNLRDKILEMLNSARISSLILIYNNNQDQEPVPLSVRKLSIIMLYPGPTAQPSPPGPTY
eukprot:1786626-Ditylum_brightwellii.AAC.1